MEPSLSCKLCNAVCSRLSRAFGERTSANHSPANDDFPVADGVFPALPALIFLRTRLDVRRAVASAASYTSATVSAPRHPRRRPRRRRHFSASPDSVSPFAGLINMNGTRYGTTVGGGGAGAVFALTL